MPSSTIYGMTVLVDVGENLLMKANVGSVISTKLNDLGVIEQGRDDKLNDLVDIELGTLSFGRRGSRGGRSADLITNLPTGGRLRMKACIGSVVSTPLNDPMDTELVEVLIPNPPIK